LPIAVDTSGVPTAADNPEFWLLGRLLLGVGLVFFVVSANAPVFQMWFSRSGHHQARDPYFLYAASNAGSLIALLSYPLLVERWSGLAGQATAWYAGYGLLVVLAVVCGIGVWRRPVAVQHAEDAVAREAPPRWGRRLRWVALAFVPSSLMLGVTTHITTDIAPVPLLWVVPLALYLLTFVLVFARRPLIPHAWVVAAAPFVLAPVAVMTLQAENSLGWAPVPLHLLMFFAAALLCHGELVADRPAAEHLTEFYLWMSFGGVLGGAFNALLAPLVFQTVMEYPLVMVAVYLTVRPVSGGGMVRRWGIAIGLAGVCAVGTWLLLGVVHPDHWRGGWAQATSILLPAAFCVVWRKHPRWFALCLAGALAGSILGAPTRQERTLYLGRNFFGVKRVTVDTSGNYHEFLHGRTLHGIEDMRRPDVALAYYHRSGPMGDAFTVYRRAQTPRRVAIVGLGAGAQAAYAKAHDQFDLYEIDPEVARIATTRALFTFVPDCAGKTSVLLGDGRIRLGEQADGAYGMISVDVFSSDAVPTHMFTREAMALYVQKLDERGLIVFNISNRYFDLEPLLAALAGEEGLVCFVRDDTNLSQQEEAMGKLPARFVAMARRPEDLRPLIFDPRWTKVTADPAFSVWTDRYSSILSVIAW